MNDDDDANLGMDHGPGVESDAPLSDNFLPDMLDALVEEWGRVPADQVLGVNYRTLAFCCDTRRVSRRMRQALVAFRDAGGVSGAGDLGGSEIDADDPERLRRRVRELAEGPQLSGDDAGDIDDDVQGNVQGRDWLPPRRRPGMPDAGVVTLEEQPDEDHAFGPAAPLVAEWRRLRTAGGQNASRVDRAQTSVRRWELEAVLLGDYRLTLPPDTYPLDDGRRADHVRWRRDALAEAQRELRRAKRARLLRRVLTLGIWRS